MHKLRPRQTPMIRETKTWHPSLKNGPKCCVNISEILMIVPLKGREQRTTQRVIVVHFKMALSGTCFLLSINDVSTPSSFSWQMSTTWGCMRCRWWLSTPGRSTAGNEDPDVSPSLGGCTCNMKPSSSFEALNPSMSSCM